MQSNNPNLLKPSLNRANYSESKIQKLKKSLQQFGFIPSSQILVDSDYNIIDGNTRYLAWQSLYNEGVVIDFYYYVSDTLTLEDAASLNSNTHGNWILRDFVKNYADFGNFNYQQLQRFTKDTGVEYTAVSALLGRNSISSSIKDGSFQMSLKDYCHAKACFSEIYSLFYNLVQRKLIQQKRVLGKNTIINYKRLMTLKTVDGGAISKTRLQSIIDNATKIDVLDIDVFCGSASFTTAVQAIMRLYNRNLPESKQIFFNLVLR